MATSLLVEEQQQHQHDLLSASTTPPRMRKRLPTTSGVSGLSERYNYGTIIHNRVFIGGLHSSVTEEDLRNKFDEYGDIADIKIIKKPEQEKGYAFITFHAPEVAKRVLEESGHRVKINGMDSKLGPAIRKPSTDANQAPSSLLKKPDIVLQPLVTPKRNRLASCPDGGELNSFDPTNPAQIPVPMSAGTQAPNPTPESAYLANNLNALMQSQDYQQRLFMAAKLAQASSIPSWNSVLFQALMNQESSPPLTPYLSPATASGNQDQMFFPNSPTFVPSPTNGSAMHAGMSTQGVNVMQPAAVQGLQATGSPLANTMPQQVQSFFGHAFEQTQQFQQHQMTINAATQLLAQANVSGLDDGSGMSPRPVPQMMRHPESSVGHAVGMVPGAMGAQPGAPASYAGAAAAAQVGPGMMQSPPVMYGGQQAATVNPPPYISGSLGGSFQFNIESTSSPEYDG